MYDNMQLPKHATTWMILKSIILINQIKIGIHTTSFN